MQHKKLVNILNKLINSSNTTVDSELITETLGQLTGYVKEHFAYEEKLLERYEFPGLAGHKEGYIDLQEKLSNILLAGDGPLTTDF